MTILFTSEAVVLQPKPIHSEPDWRLLE